MIFAEKKLKTRYKYFVDDLFGKLQITSKEQLNAKILDDVFMAILAVSKGSGKIKGKVKDLNISYKLIKKNQWQKTKK